MNQESEMTTIGVATHNWGMNYGGTLQSYALLKVLDGFGWSAERIMYVPGREFPIRKENAAIRLMKETARSFAPIFSEGSRSLRRCARQKRKSFDEFRQNFLRESPLFRKYRELEKGAFRYDVAIAGSDQIWNPHLIPDTPFFTLDFVPPERRIAYAGSFGVEKLPEDRIPFFRDGLRGFSALSVREESGGAIIENLLGECPPVVLDPTLLLTADRWNEVADAAKTEKNRDPYILCYALPDLAGALPWAERIRRLTGKSIIAICLSRNDFNLSRKMSDVHFIQTAGPAEFVALFRNADFVVTNSFHGTAFSVIYHKPFVSIGNNLAENPNRTESRKVDFLKRIGLANRFVSPDLSPTTEILDVDFGSTDAILAEHRAFSLNYLKTSVTRALTAEI